MVDGSDPLPFSRTGWYTAERGLGLLLLGLLVLAAVAMAGMR